MEVGDYSNGIQYEDLYLPFWDIEIAKAPNRLGAANAADCATHLYSGQISEEIQIFFTDDNPLIENLGTFNELPRCYRGFDSFVTDTSHAIAALAQPKPPEDALVLAQNFCEFAAIPKISTAEEYGKHTVFQCHDIDQNIENHIDFVRLGKDSIAMENGEFTPGATLPIMAMHPPYWSFFIVIRNSRHEDRREANQRQGFCPAFEMTEISCGSLI
ncbi:MAG: hypothetical protein RR998_06505 [Oscillospiraceae bacterium]